MIGLVTGGLMYGLALAKSVEPEGIREIMGGISWVFIGDTARSRWLMYPYNMVQRK